MMLLQIIKYFTLRINPGSVIIYKKKLPMIKSGVNFVDQEFAGRNFNVKFRSLC